MIPTILVHAPLQKFLWTQIVAPHGITDLIHAHKHNLYGKLAQIYGISITAASGTQALPHGDYVLLVTLCLASCVHFRHDLVSFFPSVPYPTLCTGALLFPLVQQPDYFLAYMCLLHVPNHYRMAWTYVKEHRAATLWLLVTMGIVSIIGLDYASTCMAPIIGIVIGHILYEEKYIH
jgi:hypothetical protein